MSWIGVLFKIPSLCRKGSCRFSGRLGDILPQVQKQLSESPTTVGNNRSALISRFAPGLRQLLDYRREWLRFDLVAGVSVAAVAVPTAIAYAQLIGFEPIVGLYAAILPLVAYALFGTSRQLIVNPDAATCAIFAATVLPLAGGDSDALRSLSMAWRY